MLLDKYDHCFGLLHRPMNPPNYCCPNSHPDLNHQLISSLFGTSTPSLSVSRPAPVLLRTMLITMQPASTIPTTDSSRSFAGFLADFAATKLAGPLEADSDSGLEEDFSLSYEHALRGQSSLPTKSALISLDSTLAEASSSCHRPDQVPEKVVSRNSGKRTASVTIRLSLPESEQLHLRAYEAGLTVSAYLRSCAFEVESLRAEVKATVAKLRCGSERVEIKKGETPHSGLPSWRRFWDRRFWLP